MKWSRLETSNNKMRQQQRKKRERKSVFTIFTQFHTCSLLTYRLTHLYCFSRLSILWLAMPLPLLLLIFIAQIKFTIGALSWSPCKQSRRTSNKNAAPPGEEGESEGAQEEEKTYNSTHAENIRHVLIKSLLLSFSLRWFAACSAAENIHTEHIK